MKTIRRLGLFLVVIMVSGWIVVNGAPLVRKSKSPFTISKATTYVTGPVDKAGYIDYATALNQRLSQHIKPADNANVLLWQAFGPHPEGATMPPSYFHWLGMKRPPEQGDYWISSTRFLKEHPNLKPRRQQAQEDDIDPADWQLNQAMVGPWKAGQYPWIAAWLKANARPLKLIVHATQRRQYFNPLVPSGKGAESSGLIGALLADVQVYRGAADALASRAMLALGEGRTADTWQDLLACHRLGRLVGRGATLVEFLVGVSVDMIAGRADLALLAHGQLDARRMLAELQRLPRFPGIAHQVDLGERFFFLDNAMLMMRVGSLGGMPGAGPPPKPGSILESLGQVVGRARFQMFSWDSYLRSANKWFDRLVAALRIERRSSREKALIAVVSDIKKAEANTRANITKLMVLPNKHDGEALCTIMMSLLVPSLTKIQQASDRTEQLHTNLYLAFALAAYRHDHGRYPARLSALAPKYLTQVPLDLFSGKPLHYRPRADGYLLYSVGVNGKDEQGRGQDDHPAGDDLSVRMPPPAPRADK